MDKDILDHLKTLHTSAIDARSGYEEALEDAEGKGMTPLFRDMIALHDSNAEELGGALINAGETADEDGSFMSLVHRTIMNVRSLFNGLDGSVLPGLIDGEKRNVAKYDDALKVTAGSPAIASMLSAQRGKIEQKIALMQQQDASYKAAS
ncbi:DUF2383 domain-containing protein [Rhodopseudomonas sp. BAL398]|nr:DUF2383 domain-containing protein [Rhodopseudomonas sp. BAL398]MDF3809920.1 DUF2383 domain-containing protein [Rhodopseudomonas sp. BAL398]WOK17840.1 DUF2383 domain-containing protein [Rhodopseudomonas sp. BAL398]